MSTNALAALTDWVDRHKRGLSYAFYAGAAAGVATILHSLRAFSHFKTAADIPAHFFRRGIYLNGVVKSGTVSVSHEGNLLLSVNHTPILSLFPKKTGDIPVRVASVSVDPGQKAKALISAEEALAGAKGKVRFCPLVISGDTVAAIVCVNRRRLLGNADLGRSLVSLGLASSAPFDTGLAGHKIYEKYYARLVKLENAASERKIGMWQQEEGAEGEANTPSLWSRVSKSLFQRRRKK